MEKKSVHSKLICYFEKRPDTKAKVPFTQRKEEKKSKEEQYLAKLHASEGGCAPSP